MSYLAIKHLHVACVMLSGLGFLLRGLWMLLDSRWLLQRLTRILPHVVDTMLLGSAVALAAWSGQYPPVSDWVSAKIVGLLLYIVLGAVALRRGRTRGRRAVAFALACVCFAWIVSVAMTRNPLGFLA